MKTIVFIIGAGHSGSTLLAKALNSHSRIFALSEIANFHFEMETDYSLCGCGTPIKECPFWEGINTDLEQKLGYGIKTHPRNFSLYRTHNAKSKLDSFLFKIKKKLFFKLHWQTTTYRKKLTNIQQLYQSVFNYTNTDVLVDSSKDTRRALLLSKYLNNYEIKWIHLVRDGRAVIYSYCKGYYTVKIPNEISGNPEDKTFYADHKYNVLTATNMWKNDNEKALHIIKKLDPCYVYTLRYEDFTQNPEKFLNETLSFLGLKYDEEIMDLKRYTNHMVSGNASRINAETIQKPYQNWKEKLNKQELDNFDKIAGVLNRSFGY